MPEWGWPSDADELVVLQERLAAARAAAVPWSPGERPAIAGCAVVSAPDDRAWAAAVVWRPSGGGPRSSGRMLAGVRRHPRRGLDVEDQAVVAGRVTAPYVAGLLALREGPLLSAAVASLTSVPDVLLVDATGVDHPRRAGLAVHLGAVSGLPSVGVTRRPLVGSGPEPLAVRGAVSPVSIGAELVGNWVCTRPRGRPVVAHAGWRTSVEVATSVVLHSSTPAARTPVPLQEAKRVARDARAGAD